MAKVTQRTTGKIMVDGRGLEKRLAPLIVGWVLRRTGEGRDLNDKQFAGYSYRYFLALTSMGEDPRTDLRLTGGLLNSLRLLRTEHAHNGLHVTMHFGPDAGTSPRVRPPSRGKPRAKRTGRRGPPHNVLGGWLHYGTPKMRARPWLGLGRKGDAMVARALEKMPIFR